MPAVSISSSLSWGAYIAASFLLVGVLLPTTSGISEYAGQRDAIAVADGLSGLFDNLRPGLSTVFSFHASSGNLSVTLGGDTITARSGQLVVSRHCRWNLPAALLLSDKAYSARLNGATVEVS